MAAPLRRLTAAPGRLGVRPAVRPSARPNRHGGWLSVVPIGTLAIFLGPVALGLIGTAVPAFGILPALGGTEPTLDPWRTLFDAPGLRQSVALSVGTGLASTVLALTLALAVVIGWHGTRPFRWVQHTLAPLLALPHAALALGLTFLLAASGWGVRLIHGFGDLAGVDLFARPPLFAPLQDPYGIALTLGLVLKETPFLLLMTLAALGQIDVRRTLAAARALGYRPLAAWLKVVLPQLYPQIRLPIYAVLAFSVSVVDVALILGPSTPPPLAVQVLRWFNDPDLAMRFVASAGACLQLCLVVGLIGAWRLGELAVARGCRRLLTDGRRGRTARSIRLPALGGWVVLTGLCALATLAMILKSVAGRWRFPDLLPTAFTLDAWARGLTVLAEPLAVTVVAALAATVVALALTVGCLEYERRAGIKPTTRALWLLYTPLLVPQIAFLFGIQVLLVLLRLDGTLFALVWSHLLFVLPYVFLSLADPWRSLDARYERTARCLGVAPAAVFWRVKLPMLLRPLLFAAAIGVAVSVAQYLPTLFAGAGRYATLTTEAVGQASGADRRTIGVTAVAQMVVPIVAFTLALVIPAILFRHRKGLR